MLPCGRVSAYINFMRIALILLPIIFPSLACQTNSINAQKAESINLNSNKETAENDNKEFEDNTLYVSGLWTQEDSLEYKGFTVKKSVRKVKPKNLTEADVTDAIIQKNGKNLLTLKGTYHGLGNATDFGLYSLLGGDEKQLIVSHTVPRGGFHYIVGFLPEPKVLFDSGEFAIGGEDFAIKDYDNDGTYEIMLSKSADYFNFVTAEIPYIGIIFRYDKQSQKFLPVNHKFPEFTSIYDAEIKKIEKSQEKSFSKILEITLSYVYSGKEKEAWEFFDRNFAPDYWGYGKVENKETTKEIIISKLNDDPIYKFIKSDSQQK